MRELPFYTNIPNVEACNLCTNSAFSHKVLLRNCKGLRDTCMCSALLVWNKAYSFPLLPLPVQIKGSMPCSCSWKGKLMFIQLFTLPQKPHLTSEVIFSSFPMCTVGMFNVFLPHGDTHPILQWWWGEVNTQKRKKTCREGEKNGKRLEGRKYSDVTVEKPWPTRRNIADKRVY